MEEPRIDEHPQDVRRPFLVEPFTEGRALGEKIAHDVPRADAAFRDDRLEDVADLRICARGPAHGFVDRREPGIHVDEEARVPHEEPPRIRLRPDRQRGRPQRKGDRFVVADQGDVVRLLEELLLAADRREDRGATDTGRLGDGLDRRRHVAALDE